MFWVWMWPASRTTGLLSSSTGQLLSWMRWLIMKRGLLVLSTSSFREMPSKQSFKRDFSIWLSFDSVSLCLWIASLSSSTLLCLLKKLFKYLNYSYSSGVSYWNWFFISYESSFQSTVVSQKGRIFSFYVQSLRQSQAVLSIFSPRVRYYLSFQTAFRELFVSSVSLLSSSSLKLFILSFSSWQFLLILSFSFLRALFLAPHYFLCCRVFSLQRSIFDFLVAIFLTKSSMLDVILSFSSQYLLCSSVFFPVSDEYF